MVREAGTVQAEAASTCTSLIELQTDFKPIVGVLGYIPLPAGSGVNDLCRAARLWCGLTRAELASRLGLDSGTVMDLDAGRRRPSQRGSVTLEAFLADACRLGEEFPELRSDRPKPELS